DPPAADAPPVVIVPPAPAPSVPTTETPPPAQPITPPPPSTTTTTPPTGGPAMTLPPEASAPFEIPPNEQVLDPTRSPSLDLGAGRRIPIGAYGETHLVFQGDKTQLRLRRVVLFFGYRFNDWISVYSELEVEDVTDFEIEQSYLELKPFKHLPIGVRVGLILVPLGIINVFHEPPTFNGVDRPTVDELIIPTTWRELGFGIFGHIVADLHFQLYGMDGPDGSKFTPATGIGPGLNRGFTINTQNAAVVGRLDWTGVLGLDVGAAGYWATANNKEVLLTGTSVGIFEADARFQRWGLNLRAEYARVFIQNAAGITDIQRQQAMNVNQAAVGSAAQGFYAEAGYDILRPLHRTHQQVALFGRYEYVDVRASLPNVANPIVTPPDHYLTVGVTYLPIPQVAFKFDYRRELAGDDGLAPDRISLGVGFMY
ncbi:MAG TPA: hypothetical protein VGL86_00700, partial [Polyangia bacterium]